MSTMHLVHFCHFLLVISGAGHICFKFRILSHQQILDVFLNTVNTDILKFMAAHFAILCDKASVIIS